MNRNNRGRSPFLQRVRRQHGVFTRAQARGAGYTGHQVDYRVGTGKWEVVLPAVYRVAGTPSSIRQRLMAAVLWAGEDAVVSHRAAAVLWGMDGVRMELPEVMTHKRLRSELVVVHRTNDLGPADRDECHGIPVSSAARTLVDLAASLDEETLETALESCLRRRLTSLARLEWRLSELGGHGRRGTAALVTLVDRRQNRPLESRFEVRFERLLRKHGLPLPERQRVVSNGHSRYRVDFAYPDQRIVVECVSWRYHSGQQAWREDMARRRRLAARGWRVIEFTWREVSRGSETVVAEIRQALAYSSSSPSPSSNSA